MVKNAEKLQQKQLTVATRFRSGPGAGTQARQAGKARSRVTGDAGVRDGVAKVEISVCSRVSDRVLNIRQCRALNS